MEQNYNWAPLLGKFEFKDSRIIFLGENLNKDLDTTEIRPLIGNGLCNKKFSGGKISADVKFDGLDAFSTCEFILSYDVRSKDMLTVGMGGSGLMYSIRTFSSQQGGNPVWKVLEGNGDKSNLENGKSYSMEVVLAGSRVTLRVDGVEVVYADLPSIHTASQVGLWFMSTSKIEVTSYEIWSVRPKAFVVMQFSQAYHELYNDVISPLCEKFGYEVIKADEIYGPGVIMSDIESKIIESDLIVAEVTPENLNVYYELGFAHALKKRTIIIKERSSKLPFDISGFRALFYENSIGGKVKLEEGLRLYLKALDQND